MQTLEIRVPDEKSPLIKALLNELGIEIKVKNERTKTKQPNSETIAAIRELRAGKGKRFENVDALFDTI